ncbi:MAG: hypothetical protein JWQ97_3508 [Phenylobacterium sp.]|nr:hypothetical protein [Phenylobacterium sp.]
MQEVSGNSAANEALDRLLRTLELKREDVGGSIRFVGDDPIAASRHRLGAASAAASAAQAVGVANLWRQRGGVGQDIQLDLYRSVIPGLRTNTQNTQHGHALPYPSDPDLAENYFRTGDDRRFYVARGPLPPEHQSAVQTLLGCRDRTDELTAAIAQWDSAELEDTFARNKLIGVVARTRDEWLAHPQGAYLAGLDPVAVEKVADSPPKPFGPGERPLSGVRVLDMGRYLAGPVAARVLAEQGAEVMRASEPSNPDDYRNALDTGMGKRSAYVDLKRPGDLDRLLEVLSQADVFVQSSRPGSLNKLGLAPAALAERSPGIVYLSVSAYGAEGPWASRGAFDAVGQAATGLAIAEGSQDKPLSQQNVLLNDYVGGYLAAAGITAALARRATEGGSYHVQVSLARTSMWVQEIGRLPEALWPQREPGAPWTPPVRDQDLMETECAFGLLRHARPMVDYSVTRARWEHGPTPLGSSRLAWRD